MIPYIILDLFKKREEKGRAKNGANRDSFARFPPECTLYSGWLIKEGRLLKTITPCDWSKISIHQSNGFKSRNVLFL